MDFSGVTSNLEDIEKNIELAKMYARQADNEYITDLQKEVIKFYEEKPIPFEIFEEQIMNKTVQVQNHTALRIFKRFFTKEQPLDQNVQTDIEYTTERIVVLEDEMFNMQNKFTLILEELAKTKDQLLDYQVEAKDAVNQLKAVKNTLNDTREKLKVNVEATEQLKEEIKQ